MKLVKVGTAVIAGMVFLNASLPLVSAWSWNDIGNSLEDVYQNNQNDIDSGLSNLENFLIENEDEIKNELSNVVGDAEDYYENNKEEVNNSLSDLNNTLTDTVGKVEDFLNEITLEDILAIYTEYKDEIDMAIEIAGEVQAGITTFIEENQEEINEVLSYIEDASSKLVEYIENNEDIKNFLDQLLGKDDNNDVKDIIIDDTVVLKGDIITSFGVGITVEEVKAIFNTQYYDVDINSNVIGTGTIITISEMDQVKAIYETSILGDLNGDGKSNVGDALILLGHITYGDELSQAQTLAGIYSDNDIIALSDAMTMLKNILNN